MNRIGAIQILLLGLSVAAASAEGQDKPAAPAEQLQAIMKEYHEATNVHWKAQNDEERKQAGARVAKLPLRLLELAEKNPKSPLALDALVEAVSQEMWLVENAGRLIESKNSAAVRAIALLLRDHVKSDKLGEGCRRMAYGFRRENETFLRTTLEMNPHKDVQGLACLRLAQFLHHRLEKLDLVKEGPDLARRYQALYGKEFLEALQRQNRAKAVAEVEAIFERAADQYGDVKVPYGDTVREMAQTELFEIRHLAVGREALAIEGRDQDGQPLKLSDYRGKVVLLYFWSEY